MKKKYKMKKEDIINRLRDIRCTHEDASEAADIIEQLRNKIANNDYIFHGTKNESNMDAKWISKRIYSCCVENGRCVVIDSKDGERRHCDGGNWRKEEEIISLSCFERETSELIAYALRAKNMLPDYDI